MCSKQLRMSSYLEVYLGSHRIALAVVSLLAIDSGLGGLVLARDCRADEVAVEAGPASEAGGVCGAVLVVIGGQLHMSVLVRDCFWLFQAQNE